MGVGTRREVKEASWQEFLEVAYMPGAAPPNKQAVAKGLMHASFRVTILVMTQKSFKQEAEQAAAMAEAALRKKEALERELADAASRAEAAARAAKEAAASAAAASELAAEEEFFRGHWQRYYSFRELWESTYRDMGDFVGKVSSASLARSRYLRSSITSEHNQLCYSTFVIKSFFSFFANPNHGYMARTAVAREIRRDRRHGREIRANDVRRDRRSDRRGERKEASQANPSRRCRRCNTSWWPDLM